MKFCKFFNAAQLISHVTDNLKNLPSIRIERMQIKFFAAPPSHHLANKNLTVKRTRKQQFPATLTLFRLSQRGERNFTASICYLENLNKFML